MMCYILVKDEFIEILIYNLTWGIKWSNKGVLFPQGDHWSAEFVSFAGQLNSAILFLSWTRVCFLIKPIFNIVIKLFLFPIPELFCFYDSVPYNMFCIQYTQS